MAARALFASVLLSAAIAQAQGTRLPSAPLAPKSYAECDAGAAQWSKVISGVQQRHSSCLASAACKGARRNPAYRGPCSCEACHSLHDAMLGYPKLRASQAQSCREQVQAHLKQQRAWEEHLARMKGGPATQSVPLATAPSRASSSRNPPRSPSPEPSAAVASAALEPPAESHAKVETVLEELARISIAAPGGRANQPGKVSLANQADGSPAQLPDWVTTDALNHTALASRGVYTHSGEGPEPSRASLERAGYDVRVIELQTRPDKKFMIAERVNADRTAQAIVSLEGSESGADWRTNFVDADTVQISPRDGQMVFQALHCEACVRVHRGFLTEAEAVYHSPAFRRQIAMAGANPDHRLVFTGHSQAGGSAPLLAALTVARHPNLRDRVSVVTYATPGAFQNDQSVAWFNRQVPRSVNFVNQADPIRHTRIEFSRGGETYTFSGPRQPTGFFNTDAHSMDLYVDNISHITEEIRANNRCEYCVLRP